MIWRSLTCFSALAAAASAAVVSGSVMLKDARGGQIKDFSGVVISATSTNPGRYTPGHATMLQKNKTFSPHVLPIEAGTTVDFPNSDPIFHNAFSSYSGQIFDLGLYPPGTSRSVRFTRPGVVRVFCNIHPAMSAVILVLKTPFFTKTTRDGAFSLDVPAGSYTLDIFDERATEQALAGPEQQFAVTGDGIRLPLIVIPETSYLIAPHKNKYGHDYPPSPDDAAYPGLRN